MLAAWPRLRTAARQQLHRGDVIEQVQNAPVDFSDQVMGLTNQAQGSPRFVALLLLVARKTSQRWIALYSGNVSP
jgi:hypothetical protein